MTDATFGRAGRSATATLTAGRVPGARRTGSAMGGAARAARAARGAGASEVATAATTAAAATRATVTRWTARLLVAAGAAMLPWLVYLAVTLPGREVVGHWDAIWVGLDTAEMAGLVATGLLLRAGDARRALTGMVTATLLAADAWFDCGTAATAGDRVAAFVMAAAAELPLAAFLAVLAWRAFPKGVSA